MTETELEERIRAARLNDTEIAPLSPARSSAILAKALEKNRRSRWDSGILLPIFSAPFRVAVASVAAGVAGVFVFISAPVGEVTAPIGEAPAIRSVSDSQVARNSEVDAGALVMKKPDEGPSGKPLQPARKEKNAPQRQRTQQRKSNSLYRVPSHTIQPRLPETMVAQKTARQTPETQLVPETQPAQSATKPAPTPRQEADGPLFVAASGLPVGDDTAELHVAVRKNVAPDEPGRAEAAAVQTVADRNSKSLIDYWVQAQVASDSEPVVTLTALR